MPIAFEIQQGLPCVFTNLPNLTYIDLKPCVYHLIWFITSNQRLFSWQAIPQYNVGEHEISI